MILRFMYRYQIIFFQIMNENANCKYVPISAFNTRKTASTLVNSNSCHQTFAGYPFVVTYNSLEKAFVFRTGER